MLPLSKVEPTACISVPAPTIHLDARVRFRDDILGVSFNMHSEGVARTDDLIQKLLDGSSDARTTESKEHYEFNIGWIRLLGLAKGITLLRGKARICMVPWNLMCTSW